MAIDTDFTSASTMAELSAIVDTDFIPKITNTLSGTSSELRTFLYGMGSNGDIFGGARGLSYYAGQSFKSTFLGLTSDVQHAYGDLGGVAGSVIRELSPTIASLTESLSEYATWASTQLDTGLPDAKTLMNSVKTTINSILGGTYSALVQGNSSFEATRQGMYNAVSSIGVATDHASRDTAIRVGEGAGIDSLVAVARNFGINKGTSSEAALSGLVSSLASTKSAVLSLLSTIPSINQAKSDIEAIILQIQTQIGGLP